MRIHYAVFGEQNNGHALLASSGSPEFAAKLTVLTDRPGDPPVGADWGPVVSGFALEGYFVFLRMQPDPTVRRAGMVRTYAAYVPLASLGGLNNLPLLFSTLPSGLGAPQAPLAPLDLPDSDLAAKPDARHASARFSLARLLCAPDTKLPLLWNSAESYLPTVATLWAQLPLELRENFSFQFLFAPEHHTATAPTLIATLPDLAGRWPSAPVVNPGDAGPLPLTPAQSWLAGSGDGVPFDQALRDFAIELPQFARLNLISSFADMVNRVSTLSFVEARKAVNISAKFSRITATSKPHRAKLFARLCTLVEAGSAEELLTLRNLEAASLPDLIPDLNRAMQASLTARGSSKPLGSADFELLEAAAAEPTNWWSMPFINWLRLAGTTIDAAGVKRLIWFSASPTVLEVVVGKLPTTIQAEAQILENLPARLEVAPAENLAKLAAKRGWMRLHAACLARALAPEDAVARHMDVAGLDDAGLFVLESQLGLPVLAGAACMSGAPSLIEFVGGAIGRDHATNLSALPTGCRHGRRIFQRAVTSGAGPLTGELRLRILAALNETEPVDASLTELCEASVARDPSLLIELEDPASFIAKLPESARRQADGAFEAWIRTELVAGRVAAVKDPGAFQHWLNGPSVVGWLSNVPVAIAVQTGINAFRRFPFLDDADCRRWLVDLFTRTHYTRLNPEAADALAGFLGSVDFPESAKIVRDTAVDYSRADVGPVHDQIRHKYQMARAYPHKPAASVSRLHKVLILTALPLERSAVIAYLPTAAYDPDLQADVAVWPADDPYFQVYVVTSGPGNLVAQGAGHRFLKSGIKPRLAFFAGVCGGVKDSDIGDVVFSTKVYYSEGGKEEDGGVKERPAMKETDNALVQLGIRVSETTWQPADHAGMPRPPKASPAVFAAGELVLASTEPTAQNYQRIKKSYNDTQVVDMEAYGFLKAMQDDGIKLSMVLRGVSDKIAKKAEADAQGNQPLAVKNAAAFLFALLEMCRPLLEPKIRKKKGLVDFFFGSDD